MKKKVIGNYEAQQLIKPKISIEECKKILNKNDENFSDEEVKEIRDFLYILIEIDLNNFKNHVKAKTEQLIEKHENEERGKIIPLHQNGIIDKNEFREAG